MVKIISLLTIYLYSIEKSFSKSYGKFKGMDKIPLNIKILYILNYSLSLNPSKIS